MENNSGFSTSDALLTQAMSSFGRGGGYGGGGSWGGGGYSGHGPFASPGANAVRLDRNQQATENLVDSAKDQLGQAIDGMNGNFENIIRANDFNAIKDGQFRLELRTNDQIAALRETVNKNAADAAKCCCELKLENCKQHSELLAEIKAVESRTIARELDAANAKITQLETINALSNGHGGGH